MVYPGHNPILRGCLDLRARSWVLFWFLSAVFSLLAIGYAVYRTDPFFHYHAPDTDRYFYVVDSPRFQNDGILRYFNYDSVLTGTSMTFNFKTSEADRLWNMHSVKTSITGAWYPEVDGTISRAFSYQPGIKTVIRGLDPEYMLKQGDAYDEIPTYLYDSNPYNDVKYLWNRDVFFSRVLEMTLWASKGQTPGITDFDDYGRYLHSYGHSAELFYNFGVQPPGTPIYLNDTDRKILQNNISQYVVATAEAHPESEFYYFLTPYSAVWWKEKLEEGSIYREIEMERIAAGMILDCDNIHLFCFYPRTDIICDLNNYNDKAHYGYWINSLILKWMHDGQYELTKDNYQDIFDQTLDFFTSLDYKKLHQQEDYENDHFAAALINEELSGVKPIELSSQDSSSSAELNVPDAAGYRYLVFNAKKVSGFGQPVIQAKNSAGDNIAEYPVADLDVDGEWHQYVIELKNPEGSIDFSLRSGEHSDYVFRDITLY